MSLLDQVNINPHNFGHLSVEYAKARAAIEQELPNRKQKRQAKMQVIALLGGKIVHPDNPKLHAFVLFLDQTKATL